MGTIVNLQKAIFDRLDNAIGAGGDLEGIKAVYLGLKEGARKGKDFPVVDIRWRKGKEIPFATRGMFNHELTLDIVLIDKLLVSQGNRYYQESDSTGVMFWLEKLLNAFDKNSTGDMDLTFDATADKLTTVEYDVNEVDDCIEVSISLKATSKAFVKGAR